MSGSATADCLLDSDVELAIVSNSSRKRVRGRWQSSPKVKPPRRTLSASGRKRVPPLLDDKVIAAWNGLMLGAMAEGFRVLRDRRYLFGDEQTLADWRLFTTLLRFDSVYYLHFKCNLRRIVDYPSLWPYLRDLYATPGVAETVDMDQIKRHYYCTHGGINPSAIVPIGPELDFTEPQDRARLAD
jgi:hypothetical protein